jgi:ubiquinone/menaquinone biosynthesis C-methylase UbiE
MTGGTIRCGVAASLAVLAAALMLEAGVGGARVPQAAPAGPDAVKARMDAAAKAGDLAAAAALAGQLVAATEQPHVEALYAAAGFHARLGHREQAYLLLVRSIGAGFWDRGRLLRDEAFVAFRDEDLFRSLARRAWARGYTELLERPDREDVQKSPDIMKALAFRPGERVADIGAGTGYFTFQVADAVGSAGSVAALDIAPEMLEYLDLRVKARKAANVTVRRVAPDDPQLTPGSVDTVLMIDAIHYVKDRTAYARKLLPALAPGGRVAIIDYRPKPMSERPWGPPPEQQFPREQMDREMEAAGFRVLRSYDFLPEQFFVIYVPRQ